MPEKRMRLIAKHYEPEGDYAASLDQLPGEEENLTDSLPIIVKAREMTDDEAALVDARDHIEGVYEDSPVEADPFEVEEVLTDEIGPDAVRVPADEDLQYLRALWTREDTKAQGKGVKIGIIDSGMGAALADGWAKKYIAAGKSFVPGEPWNRSTSDHGSHVFGLAVPEEAKAVICKALNNKGSGYTSWIIAALDYCVEQGCDLVNKSLSGTGSGDLYERAIRAARQKGVVVGSTAGNSGKLEFRYPGACPSAVSVNAFDRTTDRPASFHTRNSQVDLASSGVSVISWDHLSRLIRLSGSSMALPLWIFSAASLMSKTGKDVEEVVQAMHSSARNTAAAATSEGAGVLDVAAALKKLEARPKDPSPEPEPVTGVRYRVVAGSYESRERAAKDLPGIKKGRPIPDAWISKEEV